MNKVYIAIVSRDIIIIEETQYLDINTHAIIILALISQNQHSHPQCLDIFIREEMQYLDIYTHTIKSMNTSSQGKPGSLSQRKLNIQTLTLAASQRNLVSGYENIIVEKTCLDADTGSIIEEIQCLDTKTSPLQRKPVLMPTLAPLLREKTCLDMDMSLERKSFKHQTI